VITVNVAEGGSYAAPKTVTFSANDAAEGPVASTATLNGSPFTSGASVSTPGSYTLVVDASDSVPNSSASTIHFTVTGPTGSDSEGPVIAASVSEGGSYLAPATVTFSAIDAVEGPAPATATLNGNPFTSGSSISALGNYTLVITASDSVPNTSVSTIHFTLAAPVVSTPASSDWSIALLAVVGLGVAVVVRRRHAPDLR
jgi:MYXO-CTERM domain-containing protein